MNDVIISGQFHRLARAEMARHATITARLFSDAAERIVDGAKFTLMSARGV